MTRCMPLLFGLAALWATTVQSAPIEDRYEDAALFIVATAQHVQPAQPVHSLGEYETVYGHFAGVDHGALAAALFFANGGQRLYVIDPGGTSASDYRQALADSTALPVSLVALPGAACCISDPGALQAVMQTLIEHVADSPNRFAVLDAPQSSGLTELLAYRAGFDSTHAALYAPWLVVDDAGASGGRRTVPASAAVVGVIARTDRDEGIFSAPAGVDASLSATLNPTLERDLASVNDELNINSVNVLRQFPPTVSQPVIWGRACWIPGPGPMFPRTVTCATSAIRLAPR